VLPGVSHHRRFPGRAGGGMNAYYFREGDCKEPEGIAVAEILFPGEGDTADIIECPDTPRNDPRLPEGIPVKADILDLCDGLFQPLQLDCLKVSLLQGLCLLIPEHHILLIIGLPAAGSDRAGPGLER